MRQPATSRSIRRILGPFVVGPVVAVIAIVGAHVSPSVSSAPRFDGSPHLAPGGGAATARWPARAVREDRRHAAAGAPAAPQAGVSEEDGVLPEGVTAFDEQHAGVARLDPALLAALRDAATAAAADGVEIDVNSGWRSAAYQDRLLRKAVSTYGTAANAARWVATPATSPHVSGHAVDIGPAGATAWLAAHGASWGLCRIYRNEPWHFELRPTAIDRGCPRLYADPTRDPRMTP